MGDEFERLLLVVVVCALVMGAWVLVAPKLNVAPKEAAASYPPPVINGTNGASAPLNNSQTSQSANASASSTVSTVIINIPAGVATNQSLNFEPASVTVVIGVNNTIEWVDHDTVAPHTVTSLTVPAGASPFDSGTSKLLENGSTFAVTLTVAGTYTYHCTLHPQWMKGTILVKEG